MRIDELTPQSIGVNIEMIYATEKDNTGKQVTTASRVVETIEMQLLSRHQWEEIGQEVLDAVPPNDLVTGKPDYMALGYRLDLVRVEAERDARRLAQALSVEGGIEFKSRNLEGKAKELRRVDAGIYNALFSQLSSAVSNFQRKVSASAATFRGRDTNGHIPESAGQDIEQEALVS